MADNQQYGSFSGDEQHSFPQNAWGATNNDGGEDIESQTGNLNNPQQFYDQLGPVPIPYNPFDFPETLVDYQHTFPLQNTEPLPNLYSFPEANIVNMHAPEGFVTQQVHGQTWFDEVHQTYTPAANEAYEWAQPGPSTYGWIMEPTEQGQYIPYEAAPMNPQPDQSSLVHAVPETYISQHFGPEMPRVLSQYQSASGSAIVVRSKIPKVKKEFIATQYEITDPNGHRPLRISKAKKGSRMDTIVKQEACWRCKRYRKACIGGEVCKECSTAGFRVWPSAIGCRRGAMEGFVEKLMPLHSVEVLKTLRGEIPKASIWRTVLPLPDPVPLSPGGTTVIERWDLVKAKVQSTMVFGADFASLVDIAASYENSQQTKITIWSESVQLLCSTCDFYHFFVASSNTEVQHPNLINATIKFRKALLRTWDLFLKLSLSGKRENWFPAFMSVVLGICSMVIMIDAVGAVPVATRTAIWGDVTGVVKDLRVRQHMMSLELLKIGAKGINPLRLDYWVVDEEEDENGKTIKVRNPKGMALLGGDAAAFDGFVELKRWHERYKAVLREGMAMWDSMPYTMAHIQGVAALSRVFEF